MKQNTEQTGERKFKPIHKTYADVAQRCATSHIVHIPPVLAEKIREHQAFMRTEKMPVPEVRDYLLQGVSVDGMNTAQPQPFRVANTKRAEMKFPPELIEQIKAAQKELFIKTGKGQRAYSISNLVTASALHFLESLEIKEGKSAIVGAKNKQK